MRGELEKPTPCNRRAPSGREREINTFNYTSSLYSQLPGASKRGIRLDGPCRWKAYRRRLGRRLFRPRPSADSKPHNDFSPLRQGKVLRRGLLIGNTTTHNLQLQTLSN